MSCFYGAQFSFQAESIVEERRKCGLGYDVKQKTAQLFECVYFKQGARVCLQGFNSWVTYYDPCRDSWLLSGLEMTVIL